MKLWECEQGTSVWLGLRAGRPTASEFHRIITPKGKRSALAEGYMHDLLAERITGKPTIKAMTSWMARGTECEADAVAYFEFQKDCTTRRVGFITTDNERVGASPDRLINELPDELLEIKVPSEGVHVSYLLAAAGASEEYKAQLQGQLWVCEKQAVNILSWHAVMPEALFRVERDEEYIAKLEKEVTAFCDELDELSTQLKERIGIKEVGDSTHG